MTQEHLAKLLEYIMPNRPDLQTFFDSMYKPAYKTHTLEVDDLSKVDHHPLTFDTFQYGFSIDQWTISAGGITLRLSIPTHTMSVTVCWDPWRKTIFNYVLLIPKQMTDEEHLRPKRASKVTCDKDFRALILRTNKRYNAQFK